MGETAAPGDDGRLLERVRALGVLRDALGQAGTGLAHHAGARRCRCRAAVR